MKISGLWEYEKLEQQCISMKHTMAFMAESVEMIADMNFEIGRELVKEKEDAIQELRNEVILIKAIKKHRQVEKERYDRLQQMRYELQKTRYELMQQREEKAELEAKIRRMEEENSVRPLPLQEPTADDEAEAAN